MFKALSVKILSNYYQNCLTSINSLRQKLLVVQKIALYAVLFQKVVRSISTSFFK